MTKPMIAYAAPDFSLVGNDDQRHALADYRGSWLVLYFYPKDDTPGCTVEACEFRDVHDALLACTTNIVGISMDTPIEHGKFIKKHQLNFTLLSDPMGEVIRAYGAWGKRLFGKEGILRKTYLIDPNGMVRKVYDRVIPMGHSKQVLADLDNLRGQ